MMTMCGNMETNPEGPHAGHGGSDIRDLQRIAIPREIYTEVEEMAKETGKPMDRIVEEAVRYWLAMEKKRGKRYIAQIVEEDGKEYTITARESKDGIYLYCETCQSAECRHVLSLWEHKEIRKDMQKIAKERKKPIIPPRRR